MSLSNELSCEAGSFSHCCLSPHRYFQSEALRLYFPILEPLVAWSISLPSCSSQFICIQMWDLPVHKPLPGWVLQFFLPSCLSLPLLLVWMNVSSLTPWLLDFHTVLFSVSSGCFLFLNLLLSFFWLCEEEQCIYLCLHLDQKTYVFYFMHLSKLYERVHRFHQTAKGVSGTKTHYIDAVCIYVSSYVVSRSVSWGAVCVCVYVLMLWHTGVYLTYGLWKYG